MADTELQQLAKTDRNPIQETRYQELLRQQGSSNASSGGFDTGAFIKAQQDKQDALIAKQAADTSARFAQNKSDVGDFMGRYNATVPGLYNEVNNNYKVPFWRTTANAIGNRIDELRGNTNNAGAGGYASASQVDQGINTNLLPRYAQATNTANTSASLAQNEYAARIAPFETESKMLTDRLARESTGYNNEQQRELDSLVSRMQSGVTLGSAEMQRATALAEQENQKLIAEENYANQLEKTRLINERVRSLGKGGGTYIDENGFHQTIPPEVAIKASGGNAGDGGGNVLTPPANKLSQPTSSQVRIPLGDIFKTPTNSPSASLR